MNNCIVLNRRVVLAGLSASIGARFIPSAAAKTGRTLAGVFPIGFTPESNGTVDMEGLAAQVTFCRRGKVHGLAWPQFASGWPLLTEPERLSGAAAMVEAAKGGNTAIVIGVQSREDDFAETERYAKHAEKIGADAIICVPPGMADPAKPRPLPAKDLLAFYQRLGKVTSLPLFAQAVGDFSVDLLVEMSNTIPTLQCVKDEAGNPLQRVGEIAKRTNGRLKSFSGNGVTTLMSEMEAGFSGHCPFTSLADVYASAYDLFHAGKRQEAFDQFGRILSASSMFDQNNINVLIARGAFKPGTTARMVPSMAAKKAAAHSPEDIKRILDSYLRPYLRA